ncbi:MAG: hypothetical protein ACSHYA_01990 [Opitutaceae bacterium]
MQSVKTTTDNSTYKKALTEKLGKRLKAKLQGSIAKVELNFFDYPK